MESVTEQFVVLLPKNFPICIGINTCWWPSTWLLWILYEYCHWIVINILPDESCCYPYLTGGKVKAKERKAPCPSGKPRIGPGQPGSRVHAEIHSTHCFFVLMSMSLSYCYTCCHCHHCCYPDCAFTFLPPTSNKPGLQVRAQEQSGGVWEVF